MEILDRGLNAAIMTMAARLFPTGYDVSDLAPSSWRELKAHMSRPGARMVVYKGGCENTIYGDAEVNYAFRAWHDWCHIKADADFSIAGETLVCEMMIYHLVKVYGHCATVERWSNILRAEIIGQAQYYAQHKVYVVRQLDFVRYVLEHGLEAALGMDWS